MSCRLLLDDEDGLELRVAAIGDACPARRLGLEGCEDLAVDPFARCECRNAGRIRRSRFSGNPTNGVGCRDALVVGKERIARRHRGIGIDRPRCQRHDRAWRATVLLDRADDLIDHPIDRLVGIGEGNHRTEGVAVGELERDAALFEHRRHGLAVSTRADQRQHDLGGVVHQQRGRAIGDLFANHTEARNFAEAHAGLCGQTDCIAEQLFAPLVEQRSGAIDAGHDAARRTRRMETLEGRLEALEINPLGLSKHQ